MSAVGRGKVVSIEIEVRDAQGELLQEPGEPLVYLHGGYGGLIDALEDALEGRVAGESVALKLEPDQAFGDYDADLLRIEDRARYGDGLEIGMEIEDDFDGGDMHRYTVTDLADDKVVLDGNHPLAGMALCFDCRVVSVREATAEELRAQVPKLASSA